MKFSTALTSLVLIIPLFAGEALGAAAFGGGRGKGGKGAGNGAGAGKGAAGAGAGGAAQNNTAAASSTVAASAAAASSTDAAGAGAAAANGTAVLANNGGANGKGGGGGGGGGGDPQTSLTLDPKVIAKGFANNGQDVPTAGQVASLTSTNNYINFCLTVNKPLTNGQQIKGGSCNPAPMGVIAATTNMPSSKFTSPVNGQDFPANKAFDISMAVNNLVTGNFVNAQENYYSAPQQVDQGGTIIGHTHFTVQDVGSFTSTKPIDPNVFAFFKGVNGAAKGGVVTESVTAGLPAGVYRACSINTDANHTPCLVAVAQHGSLDDCVYFSVGGAGGNNNPFAAGNGAAAGAGNAKGAAAGAAGGAAGAAGAAANATAAGAAGGAANATASAPPAASSAAATGAAKGAAGAGAGAGAGKGAGAGAGGAGGKGKGANGGRKAGGRRLYWGDRESRLGRDY